MPTEFWLGDLTEYGYLEQDMGGCEVGRFTERVQERVHWRALILTLGVEPLGSASTVLVTSGERFFGGLSEN